MACILCFISGPTATSVTPLHHVPRRSVIARRISRPLRASCRRSLRAPPQRRSPFASHRPAAASSFQSICSGSRQAQQKCSSPPCKVWWCMHGRQSVKRCMLLVVSQSVQQHTETTLACPSPHPPFFPPRCLPPPPPPPPLFSSITLACLLSQMIRRPTWSSRTCSTPTAAGAAVVLVAQKELRCRCL